MSTPTTAARSSTGPSAAGLTMEDVMTPQPMTIGREQPLTVAHEMMRAEKIRHLPVLERGALIGVLSQRDLYFLETIAKVDLAKDHIDEAMSSDTYAVATTDAVDEVAATMADRKLGCAVVLERGRVVGIFTVTDALRLLAGERRPSGIEGVH